MLTRVKITFFFILTIPLSNQQNAFPMLGQPIPPLYCPPGYQLINGLCYYSTTQPPCQQSTFPGHWQPCQPTTFPNLDLSFTTPTPPTTTTPLPDDCSDNSVRIDGKCRLIYCPRGVLHEGRCIEPKCSNGTVWIGGKCSAPGILRTILEIETHFTTATNLTESIIEKPNVTNEVIYHTESPTKPTPTLTPKRCPTKIETKTGTTPLKRCCRLVSPRMCKVKLGKWVCSHRHNLRCDDFCGNYTLTFLTIPEVTEYDGVVLMPPNPVLHCNDTNCSKDVFNDCSGCINGHEETCSSYCYQIRCPETFCKMVDQAEYCKEYPDDSACTRSGGCYHDSCYNDYNC